MTEQAVEGAEFFNDLDQVETGVGDGKYPAYIVKSEIVTKKDGSKAWVLTYRISDGKSKGESLPEWFNQYPSDPDKNENAKKWRKRRLESLGVPESAMTTFKPADVVGTFVIIGVKSSGGYTNINSVQLADERTGQPLNGSGSAPNAAPTAPAQPTSQADVASMM